MTDEQSDVDNPLLELGKDKQEELIACYEQNYQTDDNVSRRGFLSGAAGLLVGGAIGGGAYALSAEEVAAATAAVGQVGEPGNTVDVYADAVTANSADTDTSTTKSKPYIDVTHPDYGAVGDGATDDSAAIQAAIDDAEANGGRVYLPAGTYKAADLTPPEWTLIVGDGMEETILEPVSDGDTVFTGDGVDASGAVYGVTFEKLTVQNTQGTSSAVGGHAFDFSFYPVLRFNQVKTFGFDIAIRAEACWRTFVDDCRIQNSRNRGVKFEDAASGDQTQASVIRDTDITASGDIGVELLTLNHAVLDNVDIEGCTSHGVLCDSADAQINGWFENNDGDSVHVNVINGSGNPDVTIDDVFADVGGTGGYAVNLQQGTCRVRTLRGSVSGAGGINVGGLGSLVEGDINGLTDSGSTNGLRDGSGGYDWHFDRLKYLAFSGSVGTSETAVAHGLGITPSRIVVHSTDGNDVWESSAPDDTNAYLIADTSSSAAEIFAQ